MIAAGIVIPLLVVARSEVQRSVVRDLDLAHLTLLNVWRVPAAVAFFVVGAQGLLPRGFVTNAAWGDLAAGVLAGVVVLAGTRLAARRRVRAYTAFHLFSFADFLVAVGTGLTFTVLGDPLMRTLLDTPMAPHPALGRTDHGRDPPAGPAPAAHPRPVSTPTASRHTACSASPTPA